MDHVCDNRRIFTILNLTQATHDVRTFKIALNFSCYHIAVLYSCVITSSVFALVCPVNPFQKTRSVREERCLFKTVLIMASRFTGALNRRDFIEALPLKLSRGRGGAQPSRPAGTEFLHILQNPQCLKWLLMFLCMLCSSPFPLRHSLVHQVVSNTFLRFRRNVTLAVY